MSETRKVVLHNDEKTPLMFVVGILIRVFELPPSAALNVAIASHTQGAVVVTEVPAEEAESLAETVSNCAAAAGHALRCTAEPSNWTISGEEAAAAQSPNEEGIENAKMMAALSAEFEAVLGLQSVLFDSVDPAVLGPGGGNSSLAIRIKGDTLELEIIRGRPVSSDDCSI